MRTGGGDTTTEEERGGEKASVVPAPVAMIAMHGMRRRRDVIVDWETATVVVDARWMHRMFWNNNRNIVVKSRDWT